MHFTKDLSLIHISGKRRVIQRILAACIAEGAVDIAQIEIGVLADEVVHAHVLPCLLYTSRCV